MVCLLGKQRGHHRKVTNGKTNAAPRHTDHNSRENSFHICLSLNWGVAISVVPHDELRVFYYFLPDLQFSKLFQNSFNPRV
jgi:hypothetical protein